MEPNSSGDFSLEKKIQIENQEKKDTGFWSDGGDLSILIVSDKF